MIDINNALIQELAQQNERIANLYNIGPVQRAEVTQFVESIVLRCVQVAMDWDDPIMAVEMADLFGIT